MNDKKVACIVVTYNRKDLLIKCLDAIKLQTYKPHTVYIIDNASTDGTRQLVFEKGYDNTSVNGIRFEYVLLSENIGGSGGFYTGFKVSFESPENFDAFWVMDDDGIADKNQLKELLPYLDQYHYVSPNVRSIEDPSIGAFFEPPANQSVDEYGNYLGVANPFNGVIYSRELVSKVGYPEKNMFIWGDEMNYEQRCLMAGYYPIIIIKAIHLHPKNRRVNLPTWGGRRIAVPNEDWKLYCFIRNKVFNVYITNNKYQLIRRALLEFFDYTYYFIQHRTMNRMKVLLIAIKDGLVGDLTTSRKFI